MILLYVDERQCEGDIAPKIVFGYDSEDLSNIESGREGRHLRLSLPSTAVNDEIFGYAAYPDSAECFNMEYHKARIEADGVEIFAGTAYLDNVEIEEGQTLYEVEIIGGATQWAKQAARAMFNLTAVEFASQLDMSCILESWTNDSAVKFLPVQRELREMRNGISMIYVPEKILTPEDYHPFLSIKAVMQAIFGAAGYEVESQFFECEPMCSLYMSGAYSTTDTTAKLQRMDFRAGRLESATATANYAGRVYASPAIAASSLGNIVNTVTPEVVDEQGAVISTGLFSLNDCFTIDDDGFVAFRPLSAANVGFEYSLKFACDYRIESREWLKSFDHIYLGDGVTLPFRLSNRFQDCREMLYPDFQYRIVIFDYSESYTYRLRHKVGGEWTIWALVTSRSALVSSPMDMAPGDEVELQRAVVGSSLYTECTEDWAIYEGYIAYEGAIEADAVLRIPAMELSPSSSKRFDSIYFGGGEPGMSLTILPGTTLRPIFSTPIGYGSPLTFADVAQVKARQAEVLDAVRQMFNLRFYTDERLKRVYIEPYDEFIRRDEIFDWSSHIDHSEPIVITEMAREIHSRRTLGYGAEDSAVREYNLENDTMLGEWSSDSPSRASIEGEKVMLNPLFSPTVGLSDRFINAESAMIMQTYSDKVEGASAGDGVGLLPRIVRYAGMASLAEGERWAYPYGGGNYPLAAFHFAGDENNEAFSLCFENRDGCVGLHSYYDRQFAEQAELHKVSLTMHLSPEDYDHLFHFVEGAPSLRSTFALCIQGIIRHYRLHAIEEYNPATGVARCLFAQIYFGDE